MNISKAVIPVAGLGTRMLPATKSIPKEMLPVFDKPIIQYIVEEVISAGIKEIVLVNPDVLIDKFLCIPSEENLASMIRNFNHTARSQIMVEKIPMDRVHQYGVVDCMGYQLLPGKNRLISGIIEKPKRENAPSNMCVVGRYVFDSDIWSCLENVKPDLTGEIQLTDAIADLINQKMVEAYCIVGKSYDCGSKFGYAKANLEYAIRDQNVGILLENYIKERLLFKQNYHYPIAVNF